MGIIKVIKDAIGGGLGDTWLEVIESGPMSDHTVFTSGVTMRQGDSRNSNRGTVDTVSNGSTILVGEGQFMMLVDGGKIVDYTAEPGYFRVDNSSLPSMFNGELGESVKETFRRVKYAGATPMKQKVYFINRQEIKGIKFGTPNPVNYFDNFYGAELFLRAHGSYSIKIVDPIKFYIEAIPKDQDHVDIEQINDMYREEFLMAFQAALNQMSVDGVRVSHVVSQGGKLAEYMQDVLDAKWEDLRGMEIVSAAAMISYDEESKKQINERNKGAMLSDPSVREGYVQGSIARGIEAAGSNEAGAGQTFMGMGMGMQTIGGQMGQFSQSNQMQMQQQQEQQRQAQQRAEASAAATRAEAGGAPTGGWKCPECGTQNTGKFCTNCGTKKPDAPKKEFCPECGNELPNPKPKFCPECGTNVAAPVAQEPQAPAEPEQPETPEE